MGDGEPILPGRGESDYERYLRTDELLALILGLTPVTTPAPAPALERFFGKASATIAPQ